jgi:hypothetical protein
VVGTPVVAGDEMVDRVRARFTANPTDPIVTGQDLPPDLPPSSGPAPRCECRRHWSTVTGDGRFHHGNGAIGGEGVGRGVAPG